MNYETLYKKAQNFLVAKIAEEFVRSIRLIENVSEEIYTKIGAHFRHNLDFANAFLNGFEAGEIDYAKRERDERIEQNRRYAVEQIVFMLRRLENLPEAISEKKISVRSEVNADVWHVSSAARELEFLLSHTVHHHALIAEKLAVFGVKVSADFGVAPSTLEFWKERKKAA